MARKDDKLKQMVMRAAQSIGTRVQQETKARTGSGEGASRSSQSGQSSSSTQGTKKKQEQKPNNSRQKNTRQSAGANSGTKHLLSAAAQKSAAKAAQAISGSPRGAQVERIERAMQGVLDRDRFARDVLARQAVRSDNVERRHPSVLPNAPFVQNRFNPRALASDRDWQQLLADYDINERLAGRRQERATHKDVIDTTALDPLSSLKADAKSRAFYGRNVGMRSKEPTEEEAARKDADERARQIRNEAAKKQKLSKHDKSLPDQIKEEIQRAKQDFDDAAARGDRKGMQAAHRKAEVWRRIYGGYSGGRTGSEYITPEISDADRAILTEEGLRRLSAAKLGWENAWNDTDRARYAQMGADIRKNPAYRKNIRPYAEDAHGRRGLYMGTQEEREREAEQMAAIPKAIGTGIAGSLASIPATTVRALQQLAHENQSYLQNVSDIRGGREVNTPAPGEIDPDSLGQRLLRKSDEYREKATEGQTGFERYLTEALITGGEMAPGLLATALSGGAAAPGLALMGSQAAGRQMGSLEARGIDPREAFARGLVSGGIEAGTELIPLRNLAKIAKGGGDSFAKNMLMQTLEEIGTEEASEILQYGADKAFKDPNASLTAQDLKDTAIISALVSLGLGTGAGMLGSRRNLAQRQRETAAQDQVTPTDEELTQRAQDLQARVSLWHERGARLQARLVESTTDPTWHKHLLAEMERHEAERDQLKQELVGLEMQKFQRAQVEQQKNEQRQETEDIQHAVGEAMQTITERQSVLPPSETEQEPQPEAAESPVLRPEQARDGIMQGEAQAVTEAQETAHNASHNSGAPENHIDNRDSIRLGDRTIKAFQWDHPEVKPYFQDAARALLADAQYSDASRMTVRASKRDIRLGRKAGTIMQRNEPLNMLHDMGLSTPEIIKACEAIIHDQGQENYAAAKRVELALDYMLSNGYAPLESGGSPSATVRPSEEYLTLKAEINGGTARGSWEEYRKAHEFILELGEVSEEELRAEWEARQSQAQEQRQPVFQSMEDELADLYDRLYAFLDESETGTHDQSYYDEQAARFLAEEREIRAKWEEETMPQDEGTSVDEPYSVGAAPGGFDPFSRMANEYGTIEPGENPVRMVDVPKSTDGEDRVRRYARTVMEAEATPDEAVEAFEQDVANGLFSYRVRRDADALAAAKNTIEAKGFDGALAQWNDVVEGRRIAGKDDIVLAQMLYSLSARYRDMDTARRLAAEIAAEGTVSGQKIQALRLLKKATPEGRLYYIRRCVQKLQSDLNEKRGDKAPELEIDPELEENLLDAETQEEQDAALDDIYDHVASQLPATFAARLNAWRYFAMLGNPRTHIRNVVGNLVVQIPLQASNKASALAQAALPKEKRTRSLVASREAKRFAREDYKDMKDVLSGNKYFSDENEIMRRQKLFPKPLQAIMDANSWLLEAEDMFFKKGTYIRSMAEFITARGWDTENLDADQLEQARTHAMKDALHATFQDSSALSDWLAKTEQKNTASKIAIGGLVPFKRVPINIAKMGFELSPAGLIKAITADAAKVKKGEMDATDMIDHLTRGMTGTAVAGLGFWLAAQGILTAGGDDNDKEHYFDMAQGSQDYALDLGDYTYTIDWAAPSAIPLFLGAEYYNARHKWGEGGDEDEGKKFKAGLESLTRLFDPMLNMTVLSGLSDTLKTVSYSKVNALFPLAWGMAQNYAGQVVPTLSGQVARTFDDTRRTTYINREIPGPNSMQRFIQKQMNKIPGLSKYNLPYLDSWGREDKTENLLLRAFENFVSPGYIAKKNVTAVDEELSRLHKAGFDGMLPSKAKTNTKINDRYLSKDEYETLVRTQGSQARNMLAEVIDTPEYKGLTDSEKAAYVKKIFDFSQQIGKLAVGMPEDKADGYVLKAKEGQATLGLDPAKYLAMYARKSIIDKDESIEDKTTKAIDFSLAVDARTDMTEEQKQFVKDNIKFFNMFPVSTAGFEKGIAAGLSADESKAMLALKKTADTDGNGSYTNLELYEAINNSDLSDEKKAQYWEAMKPSNTNKSWMDIQQESKEAAATREKWTAAIGDVSQETIDTFNGNVNSIGGYNSMSYTAFFDLMDSMRVPESQRAGYYAIVQSNKGKPWTKTYAEAKKYKGR